MFRKRGILSAGLMLAVVFNWTAIPVVQAQSGAIPRATVIKLILNTDLSTAKTEQGDKFTATVAQDVVSNGATLIRHGAVVNGTVTQVQIGRASCRERV